MQIVIDINEHLYKMIKTLGLVVEDGDAVVVSEAIKNGTPLPKGHGRLIDADALKETFIDSNIYLKGNEKGFWCFRCKEIKNAPAIIEADKAESEDKK